MALVQLTGGNFQDAEGNVLDNGYLTMALSHDEQDPSTGTQIAAGLPVRILLDNLGNVAGIQKVWATDVLLPAGAYYIVEAFRSDGTMAWDSPQFQVVPSGSSLNIGTWIPSQPVPQPPAPTVVFQTNGVNNGSQVLENLVAGSNITLANSGGNTTITATSGGASFAANSGAMLIGPFLELPYFFANSYLPTGTAINQVRVTRMYLPFSMTLSKCTFTVNSGGGSSNSHFSFGFYTFAGSKVVDSGVQTVNANQVFTLSFGPTTLASGVYYYAQTGDNTSPNLWGIPASSITSGGAQAALVQMNTNSVWYGTAANASIAGALPSTLGTLTADSVPNAGIVLATWE
jgi:hypothetical protein